MHQSSKESGATMAKSTKATLNAGRPTTLGCTPVYLPDQSLRLAEVRWRRRLIRRRRTFSITFGIPRATTGSIISITTVTILNVELEHCGIGNRKEMQQRSNYLNTGNITAHFSRNNS